MAENVKKGSGKKVAIIVGSIVGALIIGIVLLVVFVFNSSKKLECTSSIGSLTIMYNDNEIVGYTAKNYTYELDQQKAVAKEKGIEEYLVEFESWWKTSQAGTCVRK